MKRKDFPSRDGRPSSETRSGGNGGTSENANCPQFTILHRNGTHEVSERTHVFSDADLAPVVAADRPTLGIFAACACYR